MITEILGKISITPKGQWVAGSYERLDLVTNAGSSYLSLKDNNSSILTVAADWMLVADKGDPFLYEDFTPEQLESLKCNSGVFIGEEEPTDLDVNVWIDVDDEEVITIESMVNTTYSNLLNLRNNNQLVPGTQYRITDYSTTTSQPDTLSAGHDFDIIVVADSTNKLNENARAVQRVGDTYFNSSKLEAWQLKYSLDNDTTRFAWADTVDGKGVIYKMIDENNNECPYDFKNIMFKRPLTNGYYDRDNGVDTWVYTFTWVDENMDIQDLSIVGQTLLNDEGKLSGIYDNKIKSRFASQYYESESLYALNDNVFISNYGYDSGFFYGCYSNNFGDNCLSNTFGNYCQSNNFGNQCNLNTFGNGCYSNNFGDFCNSNTFGNYCNLNTFGNYCQSNTFGDNCYSNTFGNYCQSNNFGNQCNLNTFGNYCYSNVFGANCLLNTFGANVYANRIGDNLKNVFAKNGISGVSSSNLKDWTAVTALYNKNYPIEVWGYRESTSVATTNTYRYFNATGTEIKGTF